MAAIGEDTRGWEGKKRQLGVGVQAVRTYTYTSLRGGDHLTEGDSH